MRRACRLTAFIGVAVTILSGCTSSARLPGNARLIWSGEAKQSGPLWKDIIPLQAGTVYVVNDSTGRVEGAQHIWSGKPDFQFELDRGQRYNLYFAEDAGPSTRAAG